MLAAVMNRDGVADELRENGGGTRPGLEDLLLAGQMCIRDRYTIHPGAFARVFFIFFEKTFLIYARVLFLQSWNICLVNPFLAVPTASADISNDRDRIQTSPTDRNVIFIVAS